MIDPNSPALPTYYNDGSGQFITGGLTIRQQFAMAAMQGLLSNPEINKGYYDWAKEAVAAADTLIAELNKPIEP